MNGKMLLLGMVAAAGLAITARADISVATSGFEPPAYTIGTLVGQNGWTVDAPWINVNGASVTNARMASGVQSVKFDGPTLLDTCNFALPIVFAPNSGDDTIRLEWKMYVESPKGFPVSNMWAVGLHCAGGVSLAWAGVNGPTGEIVVQTNARFPVYTGVTVPFNAWSTMVLNVDMWGNYATLFVNGTRVFNEPIETAHAPTAGFVHVMVDSPKGEAMFLDDLNVTGLCRADFNASGTVTPQDLFDFLALWFMGDFTADVNHSDAVNVGDIFEFLTAYFTPC